MRSSIQAFRAFTIASTETSMETSTETSTKAIMLEPISDSYRLLAAATSIALDLITSTAGYNALEKLAMEILKRTAEKKRITRVPARYKDYTAEFIRKISSAFPCLVVNNLENMNGRTTKIVWYKSEGYGYVALYAAVIEVSELVSPNIPTFFLLPSLLFSLLLLFVSRLILEKYSYYLMHTMHG